MQVQPGIFISPYLCIRKTLQDEGLFALWRGSLPAFMGALSENAMAFGVNGLLKRFLNTNTSSDNNKRSYIEPLITGGITGIFIPIVLCPCDVLKCRAQVNRLKGQTTGITLRHVFSDTIKQHGIKGLYTGITIQLTRDVIFYSSFFGSYDIMCDIMKKNTKWSDTFIYFMAGGFAGQIAWILSISTDTIKSRIQTSIEVPAPPITTVFNDILKNQGYKGFFRGIEVAVVRAFPANAALFVGYEITRQSLNKVI
eukprot:gene24402-31766_t